MLAAGTAYQILCQQLGLLVSFYASSWAYLSDYMLAAGRADQNLLFATNWPAYQILCQQFSLLDRIYCLLIAGPACQILRQQLALPT